MTDYSRPSRARSRNARDARGKPLYPQDNRGPSFLTVVIFIGTILFLTQMWIK